MNNTKRLINIRDRQQEWDKTRMAMAAFNLMECLGFDQQDKLGEFLLDKLNFKVLLNVGHLIESNLLLLFETCLHFYRPVSMEDKWCQNPLNGTCEVSPFQHALFVCVNVITRTAANEIAVF